MERPTVHALSTATGKAGIAVFRITGPKSRAVLSLLSEYALPPPRELALRTLRHPLTKAVLDRALIVWFRAPASFTGEDMVELHAHGGRAVVAAIFDALSATGLSRLAEPGDFTRRAFENGKLDLSEAEGLADLIDANTELQRMRAISQSSGYLKGKVDAWRRDLIAAMALVEAGIDFSDEPDVPHEVMKAARSIAKKIEIALTGALADGRRGEIVREGFRVVLAGPPNAGKSSVMNALAAREVAIVSPEAGTTRDVIEVSLDLGGIPVVLSDTAGVRPAESGVEREGIRRSFASARDADLVLWLSSVSEPELPVPPEIAGKVKALRVVRTKIDLATGINPGEICPSGTLGVSALTGAGLSDLIAEIGRVATVTVRPNEPVVITRARHRQAIEMAVAHVQSFISENDRDIELRAEDLRLAAADLGRIIGAVDVEDILDVVFSSFCIGK